MGKVTAHHLVMHLPCHILHPSRQTNRMPRQGHKLHVMTSVAASERIWVKVAGCEHPVVAVHLEYCPQLCLCVVSERFAWWEPAASRVIVRLVAKVIHNQVRQDPAAKREIVVCEARCGWTGSIANGIQELARQSCCRLSIKYLRLE